MDSTLPELNPEYLREVLQVLQEYKVNHFKCAQFSVLFTPEQAEEEDDDADESISTDVRGFAAPNSDDEDEDEEVDVARGHRALLGGHLPSMAPTKPSLPVGVVALKKD
jgi:hypothetical protein